ncbi:hypothetical protein SLEP1_g7292 [Rubroshorea leprosula]|uniref:Uncharacterized protein n=1 Tax=Rubroshorea leprosula TaxID=152421 RepID=A0AAV5I5Z1_9ROSI|nr:hypothetical protein SLEP1_g7292 [Rubroshorea leprosula]
MSTIMIKNSMNFDESFLWSIETGQSTKQAWTKLVLKLALQALGSMFDRASN